MAKYGKNRKMPKLGRMSTDENICPGLVTPRDRIYSPSLRKGLRGRKKT